jgi:predicted PurR-regulated permease PerM
MARQPHRREDLQLPHSVTRGRLRAFVLLVLTLIGLWLCVRLTLPFLPALAWALAFAILFAPAHRWVEAKLRSPNLAASISVLLIAALVVIPAVFVADRLLDEATKGAVAVRAKLDSGEWRQGLEAHRVTAIAAQLLDRLELPELLGRIGTWLTNESTSLVRGWLWEIVTLLMTFYVLFYFLRDRKAALQTLKHLSPLSEGEMDRLFGRISDTVYATFYGTFAVAVVQGALGGLMLWWLGLSAPLLWGLVMGLLAVVPVLGAFIVWVPIAVFLALDGSWGKALTLAFWGAVVIGSIDNVLYPMLVGDRMRLHTIPAFIAVVGGLVVFGSSGLLLGPLVVTSTLFCLEIWRAQIPRGQVEDRPSSSRQKDSS